MKLYAALATAIAAVAAITLFVYPFAPEDGAAKHAAFDQQSDRDYSLRMPGVEAECAIAKEAAAAPGVSALRKAPGCARVHPAMARVRYWSEDVDGSVTFLSADGETLIRFGVADGPGYESFEPASANLTLATATY